jgi:hypothetical protein
MWGQCGDVVQLQIVDCSLVEGFVDLFGVKTCACPVFYVLDEPLYDTCCYNIKCLKNKCHTSAHRERRKQAKRMSSHQKDQQDLRQDYSQQSVVEQHHRTGPTSTEDVCTHIMEQTQGSTWQLKTFLTHSGII